MAIYFLDSTALIKRYVDEIGTEWVRGIAEPAMDNRVYVAQTTLVEVASAVNCRQRDGNISGEEADHIVSNIQRHFAEQYTVLIIGADTIDHAVNSAIRHRLRTCAAIQLAAAMVLFLQCQEDNLPLTFISTDAALNDAACREGITVEDPNDPG